MIYWLKQLIRKWVGINCRVCWDTEIGKCVWCKRIKKRDLKKFVSNLKFELPIRSGTGTPMTDDERSLLNRFFKEEDL